MERISRPSTAAPVYRPAKSASPPFHMVNIHIYIYSTPTNGRRGRSLIIIGIIIIIIVIMDGNT